MLIGIDASRANHETKTGVEWYAWHIIQEFKAQSEKGKTGGDVQFILYSDTPLSGELAQLPKNWQAKVLHWPMRFWTQVRLSWEMLVHPPDVLFIPAHVFPIIHPKKTVMIVHDVAAAGFPDSYNWFEQWYTIWSAKYAVKHLWKVITPSEFTKRELLSLELRIKNPAFASASAGRQESRVFVVHHGYDTRYRKINDEQYIDSVLKKYNIKKPFMLNVGRLEEKKNTANLIRAFTQFRMNSRLQTTDYRLQLVLVGQPGYGYEKVQEAIAQSAYKQDIRLPGWVPPEDIVALMNATEAFVFPSLYEGFGLPILEAFACGTPVLASKGGSLEEVGQDAAIFVDPPSMEDIVVGMERVAADQFLRQSLIQKGMGRMENFSWDKAARETLEILLASR